MPRMTNSLIERQAHTETVLALLGNALVYLRLIDMRVRMAAANQPDLMAPAIDDLSSACGLIRTAQGEMGKQA